MIRLYHNDMSVCAAKVRMALAEKGLAWDGVHMDLRAGDALKPEYLKLNPNGVVPTLVHDSRVVIESTVICEYVEDAFPSPRLSGSAFERSRMRMWTKQLDEGLHISVGNLSFCIAFRHQFLSKPKEELEAYFAAIPSAETRERRRMGVERGMDSPAFLPSLKRWDQFFRDVEAQDDPWLAGSAFSLADIGYAPYMIRLEHLGLDTLWEHRPRAAAWRRRLLERPSYKEAIEKWLNPKYLELFDRQRPEAAARARQLMSTT